MPTTSFSRPISTQPSFPKPTWKERKLVIAAKEARKLSWAGTGSAATSTASNGTSAGVLALVRTRSRMCCTSMQSRYRARAREAFVRWLVVESSRQRKDFARILQLAMWIRKISFAVGAHRPTSPSTHAISRTDTFKGKNLIESCCIVFQLEVSQKKELQTGEILASRVPVYDT